MSECSEGQRVSGAVSGFHGPGLAVVPLMLHWELPEPFSLGSEDVVEHVCASFFLQLIFGEKSNNIPRCVLPASWEGQPELLAAPLPAKLPSKIGQGKRAEGTSFMLGVQHSALW